mmetsp:Transcript_11319/g.14699  ORF Transcript_11319/g.14699 Transcript_11319/m.14699 type:complete len:386 (-) Transcript_11319:1877-3034(-)
MKLLYFFFCVLGCAAFQNAPNSFVDRNFNAKVSSRSPMRMTVEEGNDYDFSKLFQTAAISFSLVAGAASFNPNEALAAQSGGRVSGKSSFSSPARTASPGYGGSQTAMYSAPAIVPVPVAPMWSPFGFSPFGFGGFGFGYSPFGFGVSLFNPIPLIIFGGIAWGVLQLVRGVTGSGDWGSLDDEVPSSLGAGVSVFKVQVAVNCPNRGPGSLLADLQRVSAMSDTTSRAGLSGVVQETALTLLRRSSEWEAAASSVEYFNPRNADQAESAFNKIAVMERSKLEKETFGNVGGFSIGEGRPERGVDKPTLAVVTIALAIRGDTLKQFDGVSSMSGLKSALQSLAADVTTDMGENVLATELLWTPEDPAEIMLREDMVVDFPELVDL